MSRPSWIKTSYVYPPIPIRNMDWAAWDDRLGGDCSPYGRGRTEEEAVADLLEQMEQDQ
jgi:hypothetical protein